VEAARKLATRHVIATSIVAGASVATLSIGHDVVRSCRVPCRAVVPNGTGDLLAGLIAGNWSYNRAVAAVDAVIDASAGHDELQLTRSRRVWLDSLPLPEISFDAVL
jgi:pyridoxal/pyridoxine/pyridoxamine kinase